MSVRFGLGLRAEIVLVLMLAFIASFTLLGIATVQLTQRALALDRANEVDESCERLARELWHARENASDNFHQIAPVLIGRYGIAGIEWLRPTGDLASGSITGHPVERKVKDGSVVRMWYRAPIATDVTPVTNLLLLYVAMTGGTILLLTYVVLTYLIVRPLEAVTRASERLATGTQLQLVTVPEQGAGEVKRLAVAFNDMARQLRGERTELEQRLRELERAAAELRSAQGQLVRSEKLASVGRLSAGVAHEIGNPLAAILGMIELLRGGDLEPAEREEFLRRIQGETERINKIIRNLLGFSRQGSPPSNLDVGDADLTQVVEDAVRLIAPQKDLRGITIERRFQADAPRVRGAADSITQVVLNLLLNAADAIHGDGTILIEVAARDQNAVLRVTDSGPGVPPELLSQIFEPFVTTKPVGEGTGLGLAVCQNLVQSMGGSLRVENTTTGGACFEVVLPGVRASS